MVAPVVAASLISGGASFLGGLFSNNQEKKALERANYLNSPAGIRAEAEAAGFNPLVFAGVGTGTGAQYAPNFSNPLAAASSIVADGFIANEGMKIQQAQLELENRRLEETVKALEFKPTVGGIYPRANTGKNSDLDPETPHLRDVAGGVDTATEGLNVEVPVGPDFDEIITGAVINQIGLNKARIRTERGWDPYGPTPQELDYQDLYLEGSMVTPYAGHVAQFHHLNKIRKERKYPNVD